MKYEMESDITFRLWYPAEKRMVYKGSLTFDLSDGSWLWEGRHGSFHSHFGNIMRWTGKTDKDKKKIFEGDIITCGKGICSVGWQDGAFAFCNNRDWIDEWNWADDSHRFKVIGNIYENNDILSKYPN